MGNEYVLLPNGDFASVDALNHSGIKGMKWGIRRYQNKDGSLTAAGKKRYTAEAEKLKEREKTIKNQERVRAKVDKLNAKKSELDERQKALDEANGVKKSKFGFKKKDGDTEENAKSAKDMSDEELYKALNRARMESEYNRLTNPQQMNNNQQQGNGQQQGKSSGMMAEMVKPAVVNAGRNFLQNALTKVGNDLLKDKEDPNSVEALRKMSEKLSLQKKIDRMKKDGPDSDLSVDDQIKKYNFEKDKKKDAAAEAKRKSDMDAYNAYQQDYMDSISKSTATESSTYRNKGGERGYVNPNESRSLAIYNSPMTSVSTSTISRGKSATDSYANVSVYDLLDGNGNVIRSFGDDD